MYTLFYWDTGSVCAYIADHDAQRGLEAGMERSYNSHRLCPSLWESLELYWIVSNPAPKFPAAAMAAAERQAYHGSMA